VRGWFPPISRLGNGHADPVLKMRTVAARLDIDIATMLAEQLGGTIARRRPETGIRLRQVYQGEK
jgi:hypothetical protein